MTIGGVWGKLLHIDLSDGRQWIEALPDELYLKLVGGRALAAYLLLRDMPAGADPLGPDNPLIFAPGTAAPGKAPTCPARAGTASRPKARSLAPSPARRWVAGGGMSSSAPASMR
jgi:aldehyde:ferredoxin oxidoreductase